MAVFSFVERRSYKVPIELISFERFVISSCERSRPSSVKYELHDFFIYCLSQNEKEPLWLLFGYASSIKKLLDIH